MIADEPESGDEGSPAWMTSLADMTLLLLSFFVLLHSFARTDTRTFQSALGSVREALGAPERPLPQEPVSALAPLTAVPEKAPPARTLEEAPGSVLAFVEALLAERGLSEQVAVSESERGLTLRTREAVLFDSGAAELEHRGEPVLAAVLELAAHLQAELVVEGHTDDRPIQNALFPSNWELSAARSSAVLRQLLAAGMNPGRLHVAGYADTRPVASNATEVGRTQNRRVDFVFEYDAALSSGAPAPRDPRALTD